MSGNVQKFFGVKMKKIIFVTLCIFKFCLLFAANAKYQSEEFNLNVNYNDQLVPGDAVFVRMAISTPKSHKRSKSDNEHKASLQLLNEKKIVEQAPFYQIGKTKKANYVEMLCGIPLSWWLKDDNYSLKITFQTVGKEIKEFTLPVTFTLRQFPEDVIYLDAKNSAIKTNSSPERAAQIEKLNAILFTTMPQDIYSLKAFKEPGENLRYTANAGDRRTYSYSNGKSSTSIHYGNDYGMPVGTTVRSCAEGRIVMAENRISTGWSIVIEHLPGLYSLYYHLNEVNVKEGEMVNQGEAIGKSGATGLATGPHLHWEVRLNGQAIRPEFFLNDFTFDYLSGAK